MATAFFPGSFDPFTAGHKSVVDRILPLFGRVVIGIGDNRAKQRSEPAAESLAKIRHAFAGREGVEAVVFSGLAIEAAREAGADVIVKGVRGMADFESELRQADINRRIGHIETLLVPALPEMECVSSSVARELRSFGSDISWLLP